MTAAHKLSIQRSTRSLFAIFAVATIVPLILLVALPLQMATSALGGQSTDRVADTSSIAADTLGLQLESVKALTSSYSQRTEIVDAALLHNAGGVNGTVRRAMREFQQANSAMKESVLVDSEGKILSLEPHAINAPYPANVMGENSSFRDDFTRAIGSSDSYVSEVFANAETANTEYIAVSHRIVDANGNAVGVLIAAIDSKAVFQTYVDRFKADHGVELAVFDQKSHVVAAKGVTNEIGPANDQHLTAAISGSKWSGTMKSGNQRVVSAYTPIPGTGWVVSATVPRSDAFAAINTLESRVIITALIVGSVVLCAIVLLARSIRAREKIEGRLRSSEMRTRSILDTAHQMFCELDEQGRITDWNVQAEQLLGWTREEALGHRAIDLIVPEDRREASERLLAEMLSPAHADTHSHKETSLLIRKDSEQYLPVEISSWVTITEGHRSVNVFVQDISDRLRLQKEQEVVVKRQRVLLGELRAADKAKSDFISTISHELRTPLTSITGYLEMLQDGLGGALNENQQMMIDVVDRNSHRLLNLIEDVLTLSRVESGSFKVDRTEADIRSLISGAVETLLPSIHTNGLRLDVDVAQNCGSLIGDGDQLERVMLNLMNNAVKFTPSGGRISVTAYRQEQSVVITVSDTGAGIPIEEQPHLFSRFFRASTAQAQAVQGTGLGLTIVKSIVERHGGTVSLQSAPGVGTTVYVELPVDVTAIAAVPARD